MQEASRTCQLVPHQINTAQISVPRSSCPLFCAHVLSPLQTRSGGRYSPDSRVLLPWEPKGWGFATHHLQYPSPLQVSGEEGSVFGPLSRAPSHAHHAPLHRRKLSRNPTHHRTMLLPKRRYPPGSLLAGEGGIEPLGVEGRHTGNTKHPPMMVKGCQPHSLPPPCHEREAEPGNCPALGCTSVLSPSGDADAKVKPLKGWN